MNKDRESHIPSIKDLHGEPQFSLSDELAAKVRNFTGKLPDETLLADLRLPQSYLAASDKRRVVSNPPPGWAEFIQQFDARTEKSQLMRVVNQTMQNGFITVADVRNANIEELQKGKRKFHGNVGHVIATFVKIIFSPIENEN